MGKIKNIKARQIFDSRGNPTVEVDVFTDKNDLFLLIKMPRAWSFGQVPRAHVLAGSAWTPFLTPEPFRTGL